MWNLICWWVKNELSMILKPCKHCNVRAHYLFHVCRQCCILFAVFLSTILASKPCRTNLLIWRCHGLTVADRPIRILIVHQVIVEHGRRPESAHRTLAIQGDSYGAFFSSIEARKVWLCHWSKYQHWHSSIEMSGNLSSSLHVLDCHSGDLLCIFIFIRTFHSCVKTRNGPNHPSRALLLVGILGCTFVSSLACLLIIYARPLCSTDLHFLRHLVIIFCFQRTQFDYNTLIRRENASPFSVAWTAWF